MRSLTVVLACSTFATTCSAQTPTWIQMKPSTSPSSRNGAAMAYDSARQRTVLFGGVSPKGYLGDTWEWNGKNWTQIRPTTSPSGRAGAEMTYDSARQRMVLFGGASPSGKYLGDTWEWNGKNWTQRKPLTSPVPRHGHAMVYDSARRLTVLFGGNDNRIRYLADTWEFDGKNWTQIKPRASPAGRSGAAMSYDSARRRTVLFGGFKTGPLGDTWEWNGKNWTSFTTNAVSFRDAPGMVYHSARLRTVLFGGAGSGGHNSVLWLNDTWEWTGRNWKSFRHTAAPPNRASAAMAYDSVRQRTVLFGGKTFGWKSLGDTWEYGSVGPLTLTANTSTISIANGGTQTLSINAGSELKNKAYWIVGSATSTMPGVVLTGIHLPLRPDLYTDLAISFANGKEFKDFKRTLSATGKATASLNVPAKLPIPVGSKLYHAFVVYDGTTGQIFTSSNPVSVEFK